MTNYQELKRLAEAATVGPWYVQYGDDASHRCMTAVSTHNKRLNNQGCFTEAEFESLIAITLHQSYPWVDPDCVNDDANSAYIAAASPDVVLGLIKSLEHTTMAAEAEAKEVDEPLNYGTCSSLESARDTADEARRLRLLGQYPSACVVLDMQVARLMHATPQAAAQTSQADAQDAARYRWLRSTTNWASNSSNERIDVRNSPELWDAAIDAAINAKERAAHGIKQGGQHD